jgi:biopolymer transport protein TolR
MIVRRSIKPEVNFINLIDVMLVLLIIFMITAPAMQNWIDLDLPSAKATRINISEGIVVSITKDGSIYVDRNKIPAADFSRKFPEILKSHPGEPVYIRGDKEVLYGKVTDVIGFVKKAGGENLGLVVVEEEAVKK